MKDGSRRKGKLWLPQAPPAANLDSVRYLQGLSLSSFLLKMPIPPNFRKNSGPQVLDRGAVFFPASSGDDWKIVEGGTSRNVCIEHATGSCAPALEERDITIDGQKYPWRQPGQD